MPQNALSPTTTPVPTTRDDRSGVVVGTGVGGGLMGSQLLPLNHPFLDQPVRAAPFLARLRACSGANGFKPLVGPALAPSNLQKARANHRHLHYPRDLSVLGLQVSKLQVD